MTRHVAYLAIFILSYIKKLVCMIFIRSHFI
jgi:hypothetical protein